MENERDELELKEQKISKDLIDSCNKRDILKEKISELESAEEVNKQEINEYKQKQADYERKIFTLEVKKKEITVKKQECEREIQKLHEEASLHPSSSGSSGR